LQRILSRGEIEGLERNALPRLRLPSRQVFAERAARLRHLAEGNSLGEYLALMARLVQAQHEALGAFTAPLPDENRLSLARTHGMPPLTCEGPLEGCWREALRAVLAALSGQELGDAPRATVARLEQTLSAEPQRLDALAQALLAGEEPGDVAAAPFLMAALQVYWTERASRLPEAVVPAAVPSRVCPVCGSLPVASVVRVGAASDGLRYLHCGLCASEWHMVRVKCSHCEDTRSVAYHHLEGASEAIKAESCDACHSYRKIFYQEKDLEVDAVADDLASLTLDVLMGEAGYVRASANPLLWFA